MPKKGKDFDFKTVTEMFITPQPLPEEERQEAARPATRQIRQEAPEAPETKSDRLQLLIRPSTNKALAKEARRRRISKNELVNQILEEHIKGAKP